MKPAHLIVGGPQLTGLVDVDLAGLLGVGLAKLFVDSQGVQPPFENPPFAAEICRTAQAERRRQIEFGFMQHGTIGVVGQVEQITAWPICLERFGVAFRKSGCWWRVVRKRIVVHIFRTLRGRGPRLGRGRSAFGRIRKQPGLRRCFRSALDTGDWIRPGDRFDGFLGLLDRRSGRDVYQRQCLGARLGTDTLCLPVLAFGFVVRSLHIGSRIPIVDTPNVRDAGQG